MPSRIEVTHLSKRYRRGHQSFWALRDVSFTCEEGEVLGIIGPNGAGKTTLLCALLGSVHRTSGDIKLSGEVGAMISLGVGFCEDFTGRENVIQNSRLLGMRKIDLQAVADFSGCNAQMDVPFKRFSNGQKVRLEFAALTQLIAPILLFDEDLSWADAEFRAKALTFIQSAGKQGRTVLVVSHIEDRLRSMCTRVMWMEKGQIMEIGEPERVIDHYLRSAQ